MYKDPNDPRAKERKREFYDRNRESQIAKALVTKIRMKKEAQEFVNSFKLSPCTDCGGVFHPVAMDFDHTNNDKFKGVAELVSYGYSIGRIQEEIDKCELVCSNCHRVRTYERHNLQA